MIASEAFIRRIDALRRQAPAFLQALGMLQLGLAGAGQLAYPVVLVAARLWLGQATFVHGLMAMMQAQGLSHLPSAPETALEGALPVLLAVGLLTRPAALMLLLGVGNAGFEQVLADPRGLLFIWLIAQGAGPLSFDFCCGQG